MPLAKMSISRSLYIHFPLEESERILIRMLSERALLLYGLEALMIGFHHVHSG